MSATHKKFELKWLHRSALIGKKSALNPWRDGLSQLNYHKLCHNFRNATNQMCPTNYSIEDTEHFLLPCPSFDAQKGNLLAEMRAFLQPVGLIDRSCWEFHCMGIKNFLTLSAGKLKSIPCILSMKQVDLIDFLIMPYINLVILMFCC